MNQTLIVVPQGLIESGTATLKCDTKSGIIDFSETIVAGIGPFNETYTESGEISIDPKYLLPENIVLGLKMSIGPVALEVTSVVGKLASVSVVVNSPKMQMKGDAQIDLSQDYIFVRHVLLSGPIKGTKVTLELDGN